jgi:transposase InsO family protein
MGSNGSNGTGKYVVWASQSFFSTLKSECAAEPYNSEGWYNRRRRHSALGYQRPEAFEQAHIRSFSDSTKAR